ncbi:MAG: penicillin-binding protein 1A [Paracoccaceae bacterium]
MIRILATLFSNAAIAGVFGMGFVLGLVHVYGSDLPDHAELETYEPPMLSRVYSGEGRVIAEYARERRIFAPYEEIPPLVIEAFISAEDKNYFTHPGVDALGIVKAAVRYAVAKSRGENPRLAGASTITQQVMKNFLLERDRAIERKIKEMILAVRLDGALSKEHILELYLNEIYLGAGSYGVAAAARTYFGKPLETLTPAEAAYLAALPKAPSELHPIRDAERAVERRNYVLEEMAQNGYLARDVAEAHKGEALDTILAEDVADPLAPGPRTYFTAEIRRQLSAERGQNALFEGGLTIRATIEPELQDLAADALRKGLEDFDRSRSVYRGPAARLEAPGDDWPDRLRATEIARDIPGWHPAVVLSVGDTTAEIGIEGPDGRETGRLRLAASRWIGAVLRDGRRFRGPRRAGDLWTVGDVVHVSRSGEGWRLRQIPEIQGGFMAMDPHTGRVLALQGGFSFEDSAFNRATQAKRQPGSAFKPFVYAVALDAGYSPSTIVLDAPVVVRLEGGPWRPKNSGGGFYGPTPLRLGIVYSRNLMTVRIAQTVGMDRVARYAERFGVYENMPYHLSYALGAGETTLYDMVAAYGMIANGGRRVRPTLIDRIQDRTGATIFRHDTRLCEGCSADAARPSALPRLYDTRSRIMNAVTAEQLISMMEGVVGYGTAARTVGDLGFPVAGKTGTTNESRDAWFIGFSPNLVAGCYIGYDQPRPMGRGAYGGTLCGPVFKQFMKAAMENRAPGRFRRDEAPGTIAVKIDRNTGERLPDDAEGPNVIVEIFEDGNEPQLWASMDALAGDEALFAGAADTLPYEISGAGGDLPYRLDPPAPEPSEPGRGTVARNPQTDAGGGAPRPSRPQAPAGGLGLGTGGLY